MLTPQQIDQISFGRQTFGGYDLYANIISSIALELYARLFDVLAEGDYATVSADPRVKEAYMGSEAAAEEATA